MSRGKKKRSPFGFARQLLFRVRDDEVPALAAQLTYYLILAFFPFLIFLISILGFVRLSGEDAISIFIRLLPVETGDTVSEIVHEVSGDKSEALLSIGMIATIWAASNGINAVIKGLNKAYDEEENRPYWKVRGISLLSTLVLVFVILLSMLMLIFGRAMGTYLFELLHYPAGFTPIWLLLKTVIPLASMVGVFLLLYRMTPNRRLTFREVLPGALFTTVGWIATSMLFSFYVNHFGNYSKTYGSLGGVIVLLIWLYMSSMIILLGGEINATLAFDRDGQHKPMGKKFGIDVPFLGRRKPPMSG
ncbi:YihY/virulence factor BrkB family protein [Paenibacillus koleovorans]|uniref:YihY/virulence factor BrkB family protein n=1 Tax=Paenibacillus koleovorans TaxID=121608 RepID=UPI000FDBA878|nr:YihY/virulence factor BrkB family protein [Paenibacillus koleovorans]